MSQKIYTDLDVKSSVTISTINNATTDTDRFLVSDGGTIKYRTGTQMLSDIGAQAAGSYAPLSHNHDDRYYTETESDSRFVNVTGDTMTGTLQINGSWATTILDGDNVVVRKPNYPSGGWARTLLNFQEYTGTSLYQIGAYGSANTYTYGYLGTAYNNTIMKWYPNKEVIFDNVIKAPTFSDSNNTAYYLDPAAMSNIHNITANSFVKSGGTSAQILAADGSVITAGTNITISGGVISSTGGTSYTLPTATSTVLGGVKLFSDTVQSTIANAVSATASRTYGVQVNAAGQMLVNVPWVDTNTVYTHPAYTARSIDTSGAQVIDVFTSDAIGSVTNITTRTMTLADIGAASSTHTHDLVRYSLAAPAFIDTLTTTNFRTTLFGSTTNGYQISTARWNSVPAPLSGLNAYGTMLAWAGSDTQGFIAIDYTAAALIVGGGNANNINWSRRVLVEQSWTNSKYFDTGGEIYGTRFYDANDSTYYVDPADTTTSANFQSKININASGSTDKIGLQITNGYGNPTIGAYYSSIYTSGSFYAGHPVGTGQDVLGNGARFNIFYEKNNTAYYIDPASTSVLNTLNLSINNNSYAAALTVTNTNTGTQAIAGLGMTSGAHSGSINMFSTGMLDILNSNTTSGFIQFRPKSTPAFYIDYVASTSRVTVGSTNTASHPLRVTQQVSNVSIYADYDIVAYSDQSVKENIRPIENVLDRVNKSRGVLYDRIDSGEKNNIGFIAQELEVEFPELVVTNEDNTKAVKYQNAVAVLFEAVKEQQKQIEELKELVNKLITK